MINLLSKIFIKNNNDVKNPTVRTAYGVLCSSVGIIFNVLLFGFKFVIGLITCSVSIQADSFNNLSDAGSSLLTMLGFKIADKKASDRHPFGNGRMEYIVGLAISALILVVGVNILRDSITAIIEKSVPNFSTISLIILGVSILVKLYMAFYNHAIGKKINSATIKAVATDSIMDAISTTTVFICALIYHFWGINLDSWCGIAVSLFIVYAGISSAKETVSDLLGKPPEKELVDKIKEIVLKHDKIIGIHDLVVHDYGPGKMMISLHAEVSGDENIYLLHDIIDQAMIDLDKSLNCVSVIHMDPICVSDENTMEMRAKVAEVVKQLDERINIHDFRMVIGPTHTNVIFDAVVPRDLKDSDEIINEKLCALVKENFPNTYAVIQVDKSFVSLD